MAVSTARASTRTLSHVLLAGLNPLSPPSSSSSSALSGAARQSPSNPALAPVPFTGWLASVGRELDTTAPIRLVPSALAAGAGHQLVAYRNYEGVERILALGRNEAGQLGVGFASQEGTRGLVEGFEGDGVLAARASVQASYLLVRDGGASPLLQPCESFTPNVRPRLTTRRQHPALLDRQPRPRTARPPGPLPSRARTRGARRAEAVLAAARCGGPASGGARADQADRGRVRALAHPHRCVVPAAWCGSFTATSTTDEMPRPEQRTARSTARAATRTANSGSARRHPTSISSPGSRCQERSRRKAASSASALEQTRAPW